MNDNQKRPANLMVGTSFAEQAIFYYINKVAKAESRIKVWRYEIDIFLPDFNIGIEYDGIFFHSSKEKLAIERRKDEYCWKRNIRLIHIKNADTDYIDGDVIYMYAANYSSKHFAFVLDSLCDMLSLPHVDVDIRRDSVNILHQYACNKELKSLAVLYPDLVKEWDYDRNGDLTPEMVSAHAHDFVWWKCKHGHSWLAQVGTRTRKLSTGCPYCSGRAVIPGINDLQTKAPEAAAEWHPTLNGDLKPMDVAFTSRHKAYFQCSVCGHVWHSIIANRGVGRGCPVCGRKKRDNAMTPAFIRRYGSCVDNLLLAKDWDYGKNIGLDPKNIVRTSRLKVWWHCSVCGYDWKTTIVTRAMYGKGCPVCGRKKSSQTHLKHDLKHSGCFLEVRPDLLKEWDWEKNDGIDPYSISKMSQMEVWWKCSRCGESFSQRIATRVRNKSSICGRHKRKQ